MNEGIDASFQPFMDARLKGSTINIHQEKDETCPAEEEDDSVEVTIMTELVNCTKSVLQHLQETKAHREQEALFREREQEARERDANLLQRIELAKAMGDKEELRSLMIEAKQNSKNKTNNQN